MSDFFQQVLSSDHSDHATLYQHTNQHTNQHTTADDTWVGYLLPTSALSQSNTPPLSLPLESSWTDYPGIPSQHQNGGCYIFCGKPPDASFLAKLWDLLTGLNANYNNFAYRYFFWIADPTQSSLTPGTISYIPFFNTGTNTCQVMQLASVELRNIVLQIKTSTVINIDASNNQFHFQQFSQPSQPRISLINTAGLPFLNDEVKSDVAIAMDGAAAGALTFNATLTVSSGANPNDFVTLNVGVKYFYQDAKTNALIAQLWPVFGLPQNPNVNFNVSFDPLHPQDPARSVFTFADDSGGVFESYLRTSYGLPITLTPQAGRAGLAFAADKTLINPSPENVRETADPPSFIDTYYLTPVGPFTLGIPSSANALTTLPGDDAPPQPQLLCGLSGLETINFCDGDVIQFFPNQAAFAPAYPPSDVSLAQSDPAQGKPPLDSTYKTAWVTIVPKPENDQAVNRAAASTPPFYFSQPHGSSLYAQGCGVNLSVPDVLGYYQVSSIQLDAAKPFPLVPYAGTALNTQPGSFAPADVTNYESRVISAMRKQVLALTTPARQGAARQGAAHQGAAHQDAGAAPSNATPSTTPSTTPQGLLVNVAPDGSWSSLLLAQNQSATASDVSVLQLENLDPITQDAFQTNQQFLVVSNSRWQLANMPPQTNAAGATSQTTFHNLISVEQWPFQIDVGANNTYGDYRNVLIFKFCHGKLSDRVKNPHLWTNPEAFNNVDNNELVALSQWLQDYITAARQQQDKKQDEKNDYLANFLEIVDSDKWNGILALRVDVNLDDLPPELQGLLAGIDLKQFNAHHFGIEVSYVTADGGIQMSGNSSLFGLINYIDQGYAQYLAAGGTPDQPIASGTHIPYDFRVLTLQVLFKNSEIKEFNSITQVTANQLFGDVVTRVTNPGGVATSNAIVLNGSYENHNGQPVYVFNAVGDTKFWLSSNVLNYVEIVKAQFNTLTNQNQQVNSRFLFWGYLNFAPLAKFDAFSFGSEAGNEQIDSRVGLFFSNLFLEMQFNLATPTLRTFTFDPAQMSFNVDQSTPRQNSLYRHFPLGLSGLVSGTQDKLPAAQGYLPVTLKNATTGSLGATWYGLTFSLSLGTPGALAAPLDFTANLLIAWSPGSGQSSSYSTFVGIKLPGTGGGAGNLLSLQGVLQLSIGAIEFLYTDSSAYLLKFNEIALKLFLFKLPSSGNTVFFLFGDPTPGAPQSSLGWYAAYNKSSSSTALDEPAYDLRPL
jgi:hypothetical protein